MAKRPLEAALRHQLGIEQALVYFNEMRRLMSKELAKDDPRERTDWGSSKQTDKPWKGSPEKVQKPGDTKVDLEKWQESDTR